MQIVIIFIGFLLYSSFSNAQKVKVGVFIEAECIYCKNFLTQQLKPSYRSLKNHINITFYPFGKSESFIDENGETKFKCQHGPTECFRNKILTCGLHLIGDNQDRQVEFITCNSVTASSILHKSFNQCAEDSGLKWSEVESCAVGELGTKLQLQMEKDSQIIKKSGHVPTLTFDEKYLPREFFAALNDFYGVVEKMLDEKRKDEM